MIRDLTEPRRLHRLHLASPRRGAADHRLRRRPARRRDNGNGRSQGHRSRMDRSQHGGRELRPRLAADRLRVRRGRACRSRMSASPTLRVQAIRSSITCRCDVSAGEIVCIYGLMGAGRTELLECVAGRVPMAGGTGSARRRGRLGTEHCRAHRQGPGAGPRGPPARRAGADDDRRPQSFACQHRGVRQGDCFCPASQGTGAGRTIRSAR